MTKDNENALRCAEFLKSAVCEYPQMSEDEAGGYCSEADEEMDCAAAHLRRLVRENEEKESALKIVEATCDDFANQIEAKDALLRQAVEALGKGTGWMTNPNLIAAIRQHLEGRA